MEPRGGRAPLGACAAALFVAGCGGPQSALSPAGPGAARVAWLWWFFLAVAALVFTAVMVVLILAVVRARRAPTPAAPNAERRLGRAIAWSVGGTFAILVVLFVASLSVSQGPGGSAARPELTIRVAGYRWWWGMTYLSDDPALQFTTANEIHVPVGVPVRLELVSDNVIHSFWVPSLAGKVDLVPGRVNTLTIEAAEPGVYRGQCAEFCGIQHAKMAFVVVAEAEEEFREWLERQRAPAREPATPLAERGREVFAAECGRCHTVRGVSESTELGPDLTHLASRLTLAAATVPNRRGFLGGWVGNPHAIKPGNLMPVVPLPSDDFRALLHYLETLE